MTAPTRRAPPVTRAAFPESDSFMSALNSRVNSFGAAPPARRDPPPAGLDLLRPLHGARAVRARARLLRRRRAEAWRFRRLRHRPGARLALRAHAREAACAARRLDPRIRRRHRRARCHLAR